MEFEEFHRLLNDKGIDRTACPACGSNAWRGLDLDARMPVTAGPLQEGEVVESLAVIAATCGRCGFIWTFARDVLIGQGNAFG